MPRTTKGSRASVGAVQAMLAASSSSTRPASSPQCVHPHSRPLCKSKQAAPHHPGRAPSAAEPLGIPSSSRVENGGRTGCCNRGRSNSGGIRKRAQGRPGWADDLTLGGMAASHLHRMHGRPMSERRWLGTPSYNVASRHSSMG